MVRPRSRPTLVVLVIGLLALAWLTACSPGSRTDGGTSTTDQTETEGQTESEGGETSSEGEVDPGQDLVRSGISTTFGGPAHGDQGMQVTEDGLWCETIVLFWGTEVPAGVRYTLESVTADPAGIDASAGTCPGGAEQTCLGLVLDADDGSAFCSVILTPTPGFQNGTELAFEGTLECTATADCDAVLARSVDPGPPVFICDPSFTDAGNACDAATLGG